MPPRAVSSTAARTVGSPSTTCAERGPVASARCTSRPSRYTPSVVVSPTPGPSAASRCATIRATVVLPLVPVTDTVGIRPSSAGYSRPTIASATPGGCIRSPGDALTSMTPPVGGSSASVGGSGAAMSGSRRSMPATSSPTRAATRRHRSATSGCTSPATSRAVPPVDRFAVSRSHTTRPCAGTVSGVTPWRASTRAVTSSRGSSVSPLEWPAPRRGSVLAVATRTATDASPSPTTCAGTRSAAATTSPPTTITR